jgi:uncharacterized protein (TIGR02757 family)
MRQALRDFLEEKVKQYNRRSFIETDPVCIPRLFTQKQDIEIAGFFAATFAWGNRTTIINKSKELLARMDDAPYAFITGHTAHDLRGLTGFIHRTFNDTDLLCFVAFLRHHYSREQSLETAFTRHGDTAESRLSGFHRYFFSLPDMPERTHKHVATPERGSTCKRLNMFLRWMVRRDEAGVDFGIWKKIAPASLVCPIDVHVARVARRLGILQRRQTDWTAALELTDYLRTLDPDDPVKYDFALFGLGVMEKY